MPIEIRVIMYTDQEVVTALSGYFRRAGRPLTVGTVQNLKIEDDAEISVDLTVETIDGEVVTHKIAESDLAAALLMDAMTRKVPLPADAEKRLYMVADHISLVIDQRRVSEETMMRTRQMRRRGSTPPIG
jgi:hypothetical protein